MRRPVTLALALALLTAGCGRGQDPSIGPGAATGTPKTDLTVVAKDTSYAPTTLTAPAGRPLTITFRNDDAIQHNFHLIGGSAGDITTDIKAGPTTEQRRITLQVPASYAYQCDVHPTKMKGTLVVVKADDD